MRAYFFCNMYMSSIQQGIQSAHTLHELFLKYGEEEDEGSEMLWDWAGQHKTMIVLNGGYSEGIRDLLDFLSHSQNPYPWAYFEEGEDALDGALTCAGIVLPEKIYDGAALIRTNDVAQYNLEANGTIRWKKGEYEGDWEYNSFEAKLMERLNTYRLAT